MKIFLDTVGCRLNQSELESMGSQFRGQGHEIVADPGLAELAVVNTCAVTVEAGADSRKKIRQISRAGQADIVATGCWSTFDPVAAAALPGVKTVVPNTHKNNLVAEVLELAPAEVFDHEPLERIPLPGARLRTRAFIKVQDGCENRCTFCITTVVRGQSQSRPIEAILTDVNAAVRGGVQEVVLTGVHLGSWGHEFQDPDHLRTLVKTILRRTEISRLRLSSLEPWDLDRAFFDLWREEPRMCRHLHLPLQSGSDRTLRRMARKTTQASFSELVEAARSACPDMAVTTDIIAGFPGETENEFEETLRFVKDMRFSGAHVFTYSERPGTAAASMPNAVPHPERKARNARLRDAVAQSAEAYRRQFVGQTLPVLWESAVGLGQSGWKMSGITDNGLRAEAAAPQNIWNQITAVKLISDEGSHLAGQIDEKQHER
jgi:threonylcarbamoyladenosine tRNA methylthiotransferase MtaB